MPMFGGPILGGINVPTMLDFPRDGPFEGPLGLLGDFRSLGLFFPYPFYEFWIWIYMVGSPKP